MLCRIYKKSNSSTLPRMEQDHRELSTDNMLTMSTLSMANTCQNSKPTSSRSASYGPLGLENDDNFFDGILAADQGMQNGSDSHLVSSNSKGNNLPMKRALVSSQFWNETGSSPGSSSSSKRFQCDLNNTGTSTAEENNSFVSLLSQLPQTTTFHPNAILGPVGDGVLRQQFQLPTTHWNL